MDIIQFLFTLTAFFVVFILRKPILEILSTNEIGKIILSYKKYLIIISSVFIIIFLLSVFIISVPIGTTAVVTSGVGIGTTYSPGIHFKNPLSDVEIVPWYTQTMSLAIQANSNDSIPVYINAKLTYNIIPSQTSNVRTNYPDYRSTIAESTRSISSDIASNFNALDLAGGKKMTFTNQSTELLSQTLTKISINLVVFNVESISLPDEYQTSITAEKSAEKQKQATILNAEANAEAISIVNTQLSNISPSYLQWQYIQALTDPNSNVQWILPYNNFNFPINISGDN